MPKFVIERQYLLPIYQRLIIDAPDIATACRKAVENDDWDSAEEDGDGSGATTISSYAYRYDPAGNRTAVVEADASRVTWLYDNAYQLTGENRTGTSPARNTFTFDSRGNRTLNNQGGTRTTTTYDAANQIVYSLAAAGRTTYIFDKNGTNRSSATRTARGRRRSGTTRTSPRSTTSRATSLIPSSRWRTTPTTSESRRRPEP